MGRKEGLENETLFNEPFVNLSTSRDSKNGSESVSWMSLPNKRQLTILGLCRLSEPLSNTALLAYVYFLLKSILATETSTPSDAKISRYSGLLIAVFPLGQFFTSMLWGYLSDLRGRKPTIVAGLVMSIIANLGFGFSRSFGALIFWRAVQGLANGNTSVMRTMTAEIVKEKKYLPRAFLLLPLIFNTGRVIALALGGCLADPVVHLSSLFGPEGLFNRSRNPGGLVWALEYRFALPSLVNVVILAFCLAIACFGMSETYPGKAKMDTYGVSFVSRLLENLKRIIFRTRTTKYFALQNDAESLFTSDFEIKISPHPTRPPFSSIWTRDVLIALVSYALLPLHNNSFSHLFSLYLSSPPSLNANTTLLTSLHGGLGLTAKSIGLCLSIFGILGIIFKILTYPYIQSRFGTLYTFRFTLLLFPVAYSCTPFLSLLRDDGDWRWVCISLVLSLHIIARGFAIPSSVLLLTDAAPARSVLGTVHGAGNMAASMARAVGPLVGGVVFAWGVEGGYGGVAWWAWLVPISVAAVGWAWCMCKVQSEDKGKDHGEGRLE